MPPSLDLDPNLLASLRKLLAQQAPNAEVWAYGSRTRGGSHEASDLDLVLRNPDNLELPQPNVGALREALTESELPILVDVIDWARAPMSFRAEIEKAYVILQSPNAKSADEKRVS